MVVLFITFFFTKFCFILEELSIEEFMSIYKLPQPQWAHLDKSVTLVSVECIISHKLFFVGNNKFYDR